MVPHIAMITLFAHPSITVHYRVNAGIRRRVSHFRAVAFQVCQYAFVSFPPLLRLFPGMVPVVRPFLATSAAINPGRFPCGQATPHHGQTMVAHCQRFALLRISRTRDLQRAEQYFRLRPWPRPETFGGTAFRQSNLAQTVMD